MISSKSAKILLTGLPGCGKTTAIMEIISQLNPDNLAGFYTQEIRQNGIRLGFRWIRLDGLEGILAHVDFKGSFNVSKYGVDVRGFEKAVVPVLDIKQSQAELFVIDEIGKMECFSKKFVETVCYLFASDKLILASVAKKGPGLISEVKNNPEARVFNLTPESRNQISSEILQILSHLKK
ncbi:MAG: NTPase [Candidatus Aminicenantes bacterium]|nr:NTPase [Candidatus Aminicenantes bacterium]